MHYYVTDVPRQLWSLEKSKKRMPSSLNNALESLINCASRNIIKSKYRQKYAHKKSRQKEIRIRNDFHQPEKVKNCSLVFHATCH